jgi:hypothetical protein
MIENREECSKYADVSCTFKMKEDETFEKYKDNIFAFNGNYLLTNYKKMFTLAN